MGKIYSAPENIKEPVIDFADLKGWQEAEKAYIEQVKKHCIENSKDKANASYVGEEFDIPMGDGHARYLVESIKPLVMIHLRVGDAWDSPMADQVSAKYVKEHIDGQKRLAELFPKRF